MINSLFSKSNFVRLFLITLLLIAQISYAENILTKEIGSRISDSEALYQGMADVIAEIVPNPAITLKDSDSKSAEMKKAFRVMHKFYTDSARRYLPQISEEVEKKFANDFFAGFFTDEDNEKALLEKMNALVKKLKKGFRSRQIDVKVGILSGGGIMGFAKGGEWVVITDEMAKWPEEEIAGVLAHEICHLYKRDFTKVLLNGLLNRKILEFLPESKKKDYKTLLEYFANRWKRFSEYETDVQALDAMKKAGIDGYGLVKVLRKLGGPKVDPKQYLLLDHPSVEERIEVLKKKLKKNQALKK
jgi:predicted Zn-dependent protease